MQSGKSLLFIFFISLLFLSGTVHAQNTIIISGIIQDEGGTTLPGVSVMLKGTSTGTQTDSEGSYKLNISKPGNYTLTISSVGHITQEKSVTLKSGQHLKSSFTLKSDTKVIDEVTVHGKTETQEIKEQAFTVNAIETKQYANTTADLNQVLNRSAGVRIREQGGLGSSFNFSINGLSGKAVKYFIDGVPMEIMGSAMSLNNIPVNLAERIEVYKGVVPVQLGSDAMGGAVNVITNQKQTNYLDLSHSYGSFNTHRSSLTGQYVHPKTGITVKASAFFNYSNNNYKMKDVEILEGGTRNGNQITDLSGATFVTTNTRRFHDDYRSAMGQVEVGVSNKKWADVLYGGFGYSEGKQDLQTGFEQTIVYGNVTRNSKAYNGTIRYKKTNLLVNGLDLSLFASHSKDTYVTADTLMRQYYWDGTWTAKGATEMGSIKTLSNIIRPRTFVRANLSYTLNEKHSFNINYTLDHLKNESYNELLTSSDDMPGLMDKQILGVAYQQEFLETKWVNTFFAKYYGLGLERKKYVDNAYRVLENQFNNYGYGIASRYKLLPDLGIKVSLEHAYRLQEVEEVFGDGLNVQPNPDLKPESSDNVNLGSYYGFRIDKHRFFMEASGFYRNAKDFIYPVPDQRSKALKNENKSSVRVTGFEAEVRYDYSDLLSFNVNATYQSAVNMTKFGSTASTTYEATYKNKIPNQPWMFGNANLSIGKNNVFQKGSRLQFNWFAQYVHWFYLTWEAYGNVNGKSSIPTQFIQNASLSYSFQDGRYNVSAECRNLTDDLAFDNFRLQKPGRAFSVKLRYFLK
ncbi:TonB-dependent receptor domain-containing protein [Dyadobacter subterraneus]|uniref:TonB-dependent receptor n=1 Tax=Dyadobacter subterraneus TaxID=2773304 RepID=A0ABR9WD42_9BACT|nr:TonB-dependent receptor [Dyadobacter subterraneus]MBE9463323.1 TonB-dependent receptor [Dyadobacter subterraneus]